MNKILKYNFYIFPFLWFLGLSLSILESFTYSGYVGKNIFFGFQFFIFFYIFSGLLVKAKTRIDRYRVLTNVNYGIFFFLVIVMLIASVMETSFNSNYFFGKFYFQPKNLYWSCFISFFLIVLNFKNFKKISHNFNRIIIFALLIWLIVFNIRSISGVVFKNLFFIFKNPLASYDQKMRYHWGDFYDYMLFLKQNTSSDAKIAHPPWEIPPWLSTGSQPLVRYFLYPRQLFQTKDIYSLDSQAGYVMIAWGFWKCPQEEGKKEITPCSHGWPKIKIKAEWIIYKEEKSSGVKKKIENTIYNPNDEINKNAWGLIKIKKE